MQAAELVLLLTSDLVAADEEVEPLDRLRLQKAVFLLEQEGPQGWRDFYDFVPWHWGPFSRELSNAVRGLLHDGLLEPEYAPGRSYPGYRTTRQGEHRAEQAWRSLTQERRDFIGRVRRYVTSRSFNRLLREIYTKYPTYATRSKFQVPHD